MNGHSEIGDREKIARDKEEAGAQKGGVSGTQPFADKDMLEEAKRRDKDMLEEAKRRDKDMLGEAKRRDKDMLGEAKRRDKEESKRGSKNQR